jgi:hypothetical protein
MMPDKKRPVSGLSWPVAAVVIVAMLVGAGLYAFRSLRDLPLDSVAAGRGLLGDLGRVAAAFTEGTVTTSFISYATQVSGSNFLQFGTLNEVEIFERTDAASALWGRLDLPTVVVQATAPVEYTYFLDLDATWDLTFDGETVQVRAPRIQYNAPAIDVARLRFEVREGSVFRDEDEVLTQLQEGLTDMARGRAEDNVALVRELGRRKTEAFVQTWLVSQFGLERDQAVEVVFADELGPGPDQPFDERRLPPAPRPEPLR